jgi:3-oxoadipate enol-lactonase
MTYKFADVNGIKMHYDVQGEGEPLLLIHAGIANLSMWDQQMPAFTKHFRVIRHDVRGFGETPDPAGNYTDHEDIHVLLKQLGVERVSVVGISNGGRIGIDVALAYPDMVNKLVVVAPGLGGYSPDAEDEKLKALGDLEAKADEAKKRGDFDAAAEITTQIWADGPGRSPDQVDPEFRKRALAVIRHTVAIPLGDGIGEIVRPPAAGRLNEIKAPTLLIIGDEDVPFMFPVAEVLEKGIPNIKRVDMKGTAHLPPMEKPEQFNQIVLDFLLER